MEGMAASASVECHTLYDTVFIGLVTGTGYSTNAAQRFLEEMHEAITVLYSEFNDLDFIKRQKNLKANCLDKKLAADFRRIYKNNDTGIKHDTVANAQREVDDIKKIAEEATKKQLENIRKGEDL